MRGRRMLWVKLALLTFGTDSSWRRSPSSLPPMVPPNQSCSKRLELAPVQKLNSCPSLHGNMLWWGQGGDAAANLALLPSSPPACLFWGMRAYPFLLPGLVWTLFDSFTGPLSSRLELAPKDTWPALLLPLRLPWLQLSSQGQGAEDCGRWARRVCMPLLGDLEVSICLEWWDQHPWCPLSAIPGSLPCHLLPCVQPACPLLPACLWFWSFPRFWSRISLVGVTVDGGCSVQDCETQTKCFTFEPTDSAALTLGPASLKPSEGSSFLSGTLSAPTRSWGSHQPLALTLCLEPPCYQDSRHPDSLSGPWIPRDPRPQHLVPTLLSSLVAFPSMSSLFYFFWISVQVSFLLGRPQVPTSPPALSLHMLRALQASCLVKFTVTRWALHWCLFAPLGF